MNNRNKTVLIIDDMQVARASLQITMSNLEFGKIKTVATVKEAMDAITNTDYDVILCDYYMGGSADGQQFLEFIRSKNVIKSSTIFVMVTAEQGYTQVIVAAECAPDDYLLKPFTGAAINARLERLFERNELFKELFKLYDKKNYADAISACDEIINGKSQFRIDAFRIKGECLLLSKDPTKAIQHYLQILHGREIPWARLGLAKAYADNGEMGKAESVTRSVLRDNPKYMAAHDFLARLLAKLNKKREALVVLENAARVSVKSVTRQRSIGTLSLELGDVNKSEAAMTAVIERNKNSPMKEASDYAILSNIHLEKNEPSKALELLQNARESFKEIHGLDAVALSSAEALVFKRTGNKEAAARALENALDSLQGLENVPENLSLSLAKACLENNKPEQGFNLMKNLLQTNPDDKAKQQLVQEAMLKSGVKQTDIDNLIAASIKEVMQINNKGVLLARDGEYEAAGKLLKSAANRVPTNQQFVSNAAAILLADIEKNGLDYSKLEDAKMYLASLKDLNPSHQKLSSLIETLERIRVQYSLSLKDVSND